MDPILLAIDPENFGTVLTVSMVAAAIGLFLLPFFVWIGLSQVADALKD